MVGFRGSSEELGARFGAGARLRVRVGALLHAKVDLSEAILELASPGSALEALLLSADLLPHAASLDSAILEELAPAELEVPLAVQHSDGWCTIMMQEEVAAQAGFAEQKPEGPPLLPVVNAFAQTALSPVRGEDLLPPGEAAKVRLTLLTGVDAGAKVEALRKLRFTQLPLSEKAALLVQALGDEHVEVRGEAAVSLPLLGVDQEIADTIKSLAVGQQKQQLLAIDRLVKLCESSAAEGRMIVFSFLSRTLLGEHGQPVRVALLKALDQIWDLVAVHAAGVKDLVRALAGLLADDLHGLHQAVGGLVRRMGQTQADALREALMAEVGCTSSGSLRTSLLTLVAEYSLTTASRCAVAELLVAEVDRGSDLDPIYIRLTASLEALGKDALRPVVERLQASDDPEITIQLIRLLDGICRGSRIKVADRNKVLEAYLKVYMVAVSRVGLVVLETDLLGHPDLSKRLRERMGGELLANVHQYRMPRILGELDEAMVKLGLPALKPVFKVLDESRNPIQRERTARILGEVCRRLGPEYVDAVREGMAFCERSIGDADFSGKEELFVSWGKIAARPDIQADEVGRVVMRLREMVYRSSAAYKILEGLSWAAASPNLAYAAVVETAELFLTLLDGRLPAVQGRMVEKKEGQVFELGPETTAYTDLLPVLIQGLERICASPTKQISLREVILGRLLDKWQELVEYKVIWSPGAVILLGQTLGRLGQLECTPDALRIDIVRRLRAREDHFPILSELACYHTVAVGLTALDVELGQVAELALGLAEDPEYQQDEDREQVLYCLSEMIRRPALGGSRQESSALKERILRALFEGARAKVPRVVRFLHTLLASGALPDKLARDVSERLPGWVVSGVDGNELETFA